MRKGNEEMKRILSALAAAVMLLALLGSLSGCSSLLSAQYNEKGVSHFLNITIDRSRQREPAGVLDEVSVYLEGLSAEETYFKTKDNQRISVREAVENGMVSFEEWRRYARGTRTQDGFEILLFQNYEIALSSSECIIRPLSQP